jgi:hypothetical protein
MRTPSFPEFNLSLMCINHLFTYSFDFHVCEGTIKNQLKINYHLTFLLYLHLSNSGTCLMDNVEDCISSLLPSMDNSMKTDLGNNDGGFFRALFLSREA